MSVNENIENSNESNFSNIKIIILGVLLATSIIGGLCYYFITDKPSEEPVQEVIEDNQETENNNQNNNEENIENQEEEEEKEEEKQPEIIINNEYIPVIDCLWLNILFFLIIAIVILFFPGTIGRIIQDKLNGKGFVRLSYFFGVYQDEKSKLALVQFAIGFTIIHQVILYAIWFILMFIFAAFSKIWDKEHSWWSNVKKGFFRNRLHRGWLLLIPILVSFFPIIISIMVFIQNILKNKTENVEGDKKENGEAAPPLH